MTIRRELSAPLVDGLEALMLQHRPGLSRHDDLAKAMDYMLKRWPAFTRFLHDGRVCLTNNAAERALRGIGLSEQPSDAQCRASHLTDRGGHTDLRVSHVSGVSANIVGKDSLGAFGNIICSVLDRDHKVDGWSS